MSAASVDFHVIEHAFPKDSDYVKDYGWVAIAGTVILGFGHEPVIDALANTIIDETNNSPKLQLDALRKLRESLLKASPLVGFPRVSSAVAADSVLRRHTDRPTRRASTASWSSKRPFALPPPRSPTPSSRTSRCAPP